MPISHSHRFIYIHVPKCAGSSFTKALQQAGTHLELLGPASVSQREVFKQSHLQHIPANILRDQLSAEVWNSYFRFSIVRNPWDWLVSLYHFHYRSSLPLSAASEANRYDVTKDPIARFRKWAVTVCKAAMNSPKRGATFYLTDDEGRVLVDYVGRYESLQTHFVEICKRLGISETLPHFNASQRAHYRDYYDQSSLDLVASTYKQDIENFGYTF